MSYLGSMRRQVLVTCLLGICALLVLAGQARAADSVYWADYEAGTISFAALSRSAAVYGGEGLPDYAEWLVLYRGVYSARARFFGHVPVGAFTFGADRDHSPPWYPGVAAPFTF
jgi:hypothetical protein